MKSKEERIFRRHHKLNFFRLDKGITHSQTRHAIELKEHVTFSVLSKFGLATANAVVRIAL